MSSEQLSTASKPRISPLDLRNTDLVSRLLAATPPYLYNMSLLPNTYFFSEMLRSLVHAKAESARSPHLHRRSRKRSWTPNMTTDSYQKSPTKTDHSTDWLLHKSPHFDRKPPTDNTPLELTINKVPNTEVLEKISNANKMDSYNYMETKQETQTSQMNLFSPQLNQPSTNTSNVILPPPPLAPPMWYPPTYPTPYGIDPLHFFIDLRVSGHIYDKKTQQKENENSAESAENKDRELASSIHNNNPPDLKFPRHASAFSVPVPSPPKKMKPVNLCSDNNEAPKMKFDVKSMGFEKECSNKVSTHYVMSNIGSIYKNVDRSRQESVKSESDSVENEDLTEEEKRKREKDLRALIGLELVVDYMSQGKSKSSISDTNTTNTNTDSEPVSRNTSPTLEVVAVAEDTDRNCTTDSSYT